MQANESKRLNLYLPKTLIGFLEKEAAQQKRSVNNLAFVILSKYQEEKSQRISAL